MPNFFQLKEEKIIFQVGFKQVSVGESGGRSEASCFPRDVFNESSLAPLPPRDICRRGWFSKGGFPLSRNILRAFYVRKKHARKQFPLLRKIILLRCLFYVRLRAFSSYKRFGPWVENKKSGNLI